jgi:hypothetical protein
VDALPDNAKVCSLVTDAKLSRPPRFFLAKKIKLGRSQYLARSSSSTLAARTSEIFPSLFDPLRLPRPLHHLPGELADLPDLSMGSLPSSVAPPTLTVIFLYRCSPSEMFP